MKLICVDPYPGLLTEGKIYETNGLDDCGQYRVVADNGEEICFYEERFTFTDDAPIENVMQYLLKVFRGPLN